MVAVRNEQIGDFIPVPVHPLKSEGPKALRFFSCQQDRQASLEAGPVYRPVNSWHDAGRQHGPAVSRRSIVGTGISPTIAVAFGGGGARGLAHVHVIEALDELSLRPVAVAGSSIGAIMAAAMAAGMMGKDIRAHVRNLLCRRSEIGRRVWKTLPSSIGELVTGDVRLWQFDIEGFLRAFLPDGMPARFSDLQIPLKVAATDYFANASAVLESGDLLSALAASSSSPCRFPARMSGEALVD